MSYYQNASVEEILNFTFLSHPFYNAIHEYVKKKKNCKTKQKENPSTLKYP
jgi:hypothetical protein